MKKVTIEIPKGYEIDSNKSNKTNIVLKKIDTIQVGDYVEIIDDSVTNYTEKTNGYIFKVKEIDHAYIRPEKDISTGIHISGVRKICHPKVLKKDTWVLWTGTHRTVGRISEQISNTCCSLYDTNITDEYESCFHRYLKPITEFNIHLLTKDELIHLFKNDFKL